MDLFNGLLNIYKSKIEKICKVGQIFKFMCKMIGCEVQEGAE